MGTSLPFYPSASDTHESTWLLAEGQLHSKGSAHEIPWRLSGLRIWHCHRCGSGCCCASGSIPGCRTSASHRHFQEKQNKTKQNKTNKKKHNKNSSTPNNSKELTSRKKGLQKQTMVREQQSKPLSLPPHQGKKKKKTKGIIRREVRVLCQICVVPTPGNI